MPGSRKSISFLPTRQTLSDGTGVNLLIYFSSGQALYPTTQKPLQGQCKATVCIVDLSDTLIPSCIPTNGGKSKEGQPNPLPGKTSGERRSKLLLPAFVSLQVLPAWVALKNMIEGASWHGRRRSSISWGWVFASMSWGSWTHSASSPRLSSTASEVWWSALHSSNINFYFSWGFFPRQETIPPPDWRTGFELFANVLEGIYFVNMHKYQVHSGGIINVQKKKVWSI